MELFNLKAKLRTKFGSSEAGRVRAQKELPGVVYGLKKDTYGVTVGLEDFKPIVKKNLRLVALQLPDNRTEQVYVKSVQREAVSEAILHVDFTRIDIHTKIHVKVPLRAKGHSAGVAKGGVLNMQLVEVPVLCLPLEIPEHLEADITKLEIGDMIHLREIPLPSGVALDANAEMIAVVVQKPMEEEVAAVLAEVGPAEPEVITKKKEEEEPAAPAAGAKPEKKKE
ncbi:MAG: 50S ribosomal protein L25 [Planctomycetes bacterium]|nr:50S ribosomal protein L25 [Planctomycetota bacterium]